MVENVVNLPAKLDRMLFTNFDVFEECQVVIEDIWHPDVVSWLVSDLTCSKGLGETSYIEGSRRTGWITAKIACHRITHHVHTGVYSAAREVSDWRTHLSGCG